MGFKGVVIIYGREGAVEKGDIHLLPLKQGSKISSVRLSREADMLKIMTTP